MRFLNVQPFNAQSAAATLTGSAIPSQRFMRCSALATISGSAAIVGTIKLQASDDQPAATNLEAYFVPTNWVDIPNTSYAVSADGQVLIPATELAYRFIRAVYTATSGTGTISMMVNLIGWT